MIPFFDKLKKDVVLACNRMDKKWILRFRVFNTQNILAMLCLLVSSNNELGITGNILALPESKRVTASAFSKARKKLPWQFVRKIFGVILDLFTTATSNKFLWKGHRIFAIDGSRFLMPLRFRRLKYRAKGKSYYGYATVSILYQLKSEVPFDLGFSRQGDERALVASHLAKLSPGDTVVYDRGYFSFDLFREHEKRGIFAVVRISKRAFKEAKEFYYSREKDTIVTRRIGDIETKIRLIKYLIAGRRYILATNLLSRNYSPLDLKKLYHKRWGIEEFFKKAKRTFQAEDFHSKSSHGVRQELWAMLICTLLTKFAEIFSRKRRRDTKATIGSRKIAQKPLIPILRELILPAIFGPKKFVALAIHHQISIKIQALQYQSYSGRTFPRFSKRPERKWRDKTKRPNGSKYKEAIAYAA